ncbi:MAG: hypothetical protein HOC45_08800 [Marinovum sp.]|jgi:histidine phosphotransfer protein HptB|nr:hypothetical protein [Marinovum sp.]
MINWDRVAELREEVGVDDFAEIIELFLEEVDAIINLLRDGQGLSDLEAHLHFLKGSALNLGFAQFADLCQTGETAAAQGRSDSVDLGAIITVYDSARAVFLDQSPKRFAA